jgi:hypothetical protein
MAIHGTYKYLSSILLVCLFMIGVNCHDKPTKNYIIIEPPPTYPEGVDWGASWNQANGKIAYFHANNDDSDTTAPSGIYVIDPDGQNKTMLLQTWEAMYLDWSPDGFWIIVGQWGLLYKVAYPEGTADTLLRGGQYFNTAWSPDGSKIACVLRVGEGLGIYTLNPDGSDYRLIIPYSDFPAWYSPDSIIYLNYSFDLPLHSICISDANGQNGRVVVNDTTYGHQYYDNISANFEKKRIVGSIIIPGNGICLYTYDIRQHIFRKFIERATYAYLSPDGESIVFENIRFFNYNLNIVNWDSTGWHQLTAPYGPL